MYNLSFCVPSSRLFLKIKHGVYIVQQYIKMEWHLFFPISCPDHTLCRTWCYLHFRTAYKLRPRKVQCTPKFTFACMLLFLVLWNVWNMRMSGEGYSRNGSWTIYICYKYYFLLYFSERFVYRSSILFVFTHPHHLILHD